MILIILVVLLVIVLFIYRRELSGYLRFAPIVAAIALVTRFGLGPIVNALSMLLALLPFLKFFKGKANKTRVKKRKEIIDVTPKDEQK